ncbi:hypothetical protein CRUP_017409, partial [Coryphaenoides rupestris]
MCRCRPSALSLCALSPVLLPGLCVCCGPSPCVPRSSVCPCCVAACAPSPRRARVAPSAGAPGAFGPAYPRCLSSPLPAPSFRAIPSGSCAHPHLLITPHPPTTFTRHCPAESESQQLSQRCQKYRRNWNSIRHNLSLHSRFVKVQNEGTGKSSWWMVNPEGGKG